MPLVNDPVALQLASAEPERPVPELCEQMEQLVTTIENYFHPLVDGRMLPYALSKGLSMSIFDNAREAKTRLMQVTAQWEKLEEAGDRAYAMFRETLAHAFSALDQLFTHARLDGMAASIVGQTVPEEMATPLNIPSASQEVITGYENGRTQWGTKTVFPLEGVEMAQRFLDSIAFEPRHFNPALIAAFEALCNTHDIAPIVERITTPPHLQR